MTAGLSDELLAGLVVGRFDLVVSTVRPRSRTVVSTPLADEEFVLVAAPARARDIDPAQLPAALRGQPLIAYAEDLPLIRRYWRTVFGTRPSGSAALVVPDLRAVCAAAVGDVGVTVLPRYLCADELRDGRLVALLEPEVPPINTLYLAERAGSTGLPHLDAVRRALLAAAGTW